MIVAKKQPQWWSTSSLSDTRALNTAAKIGQRHDAWALRSSGNRHAGLGAIRWASSVEKPQSESAASQESGEGYKQDTEDAGAAAETSTKATAASDQKDRDVKSASDSAAGDYQPETGFSEVSSSASQDELLAKIATLEAKVGGLAKQLEQMQGRALRAMAEMENMRKISARDVANANSYGISKFAKALLDVADNLQRAIDSVPSGSAEVAEREPEPEPAKVKAQLDGLRVGVEATQRELHKVFAQFGVEQYGAADELFDPNVHNALYEAPPPTPHAAGTALETRVVGVIKTGYRINDRVLRPADVGVTKRPTPAAPSQPSSEEDVLT